MSWVNVLKVSFRIFTFQGKWGKTPEIVLKIWRSAKNFYFPRKVRQKLQKLYTRYDTILKKILLYKESEAKQIVRTIWHYSKNSYLKSKVRQKLQKFNAKYDTVLRILISNQKWGKKPRNVMQNMTLYYEFSFKSKVRQKLQKFNAK